MSKEEEKSSTKIYTLVVQVIFQKAQSDYKKVPYYFLKSGSVNNFFKLSQISVFNSAPILNIVINLHELC